MKYIVLMIMTGILIFFTISLAEAGPITWREHRQQERIDQGVRSCKISPWEYHQLEREQTAIEAHRQHAWADGRLTCREAARLTREQNRTSRHIWRAKHNPF